MDRMTASVVPSVPAPAHYSGPVSNWNEAMQEYRMYIGGESIEHASGEWIDSFDPFTGKPWARIPLGRSRRCGSGGSGGLGRLYRR